MKEQTTKKQTLKELYHSLDPNEQANMIRFFSAKLFIKPGTAVYYCRGYRDLPKIKQEAMAEYARDTYSVTLKFD